MTETMKINLTKAFMGVKIMGAVAGALIFCAAVYAGIDNRLDKIESAQSRFEGMIDERTKNTQEDVKRIYDIVKEWGPYGQISTKQ